MIEIVVLSDTLNDQCSWYRACGPFNSLQRTHKGVKVNYTQRIPGSDWNLLSHKDILFILRPWRKDHYEAALLAKSLGIKVWVDFDDDFTAYDQCSWFKDVGAKYEGYARKTVNLADYVTLSTNSIRDSYTELDGLDPDTTKVIPNGFDFFSFRELIQDQPDTRNKTIAWRGSETHDEDWSEVGPNYIEVVNVNRWVTYFYWGKPKHISFYVSHRHERYPIPQFHHALTENNHKLLVAPLRYTKFNQGKSNAAWIEGTMAGCLVVGRDLPEWVHRPNCITYSTPEEFADKVELLMGLGPVSSRDVVREGQSYIRQYLDLEKLNRDRFEIIRGLYESK